MQRSIVASLNHDNAEAVEAVVFIAEAYQSDPKQSLSKTLAAWTQTLREEGYSPESVEKIIHSVIAAELDDAQTGELKKAVTKDASVVQAVACINKVEPGLLETIERHLNYAIELHNSLLDSAGGRGTTTQTITIQQSSPQDLRRLEKHHAKVEKTEAAIHDMNRDQKYAKVQDGEENRGKLEKRANTFASDHPEEFVLDELTVDNVVVRKMRREERRDYKFDQQQYDHNSGNNNKARRDDEREVHQAHIISAELIIESKAAKDELKTTKELQTEYQQNLEADPLFYEDLMKDEDIGKKQAKEAKETDEPLLIDVDINYGDDTGEDLNADIKKQARVYDKDEIDVIKQTYEL